MKFDLDKSFGHPVLRTFLEGDVPEMMDYPMKSFDPDILIDIDANEPEVLNIKYDVTLRVPVLEQLILEEKASYHFKVECEDTFYSDTFVSSTSVGEFTLSANLLKDKVETCCYIIAMTDFALKSEDFHEDFEGEQFNLTKGTVLAFSRPMEHFISREQFRSVRSIFDFNQNEEVSPGEFRIRTDDAYVTIEVNPELYQKVRRAEQDRTSQTLILNSLYVPVVMHLLGLIISDADVVEDYRWANIIYGKCNALGVDLTDSNQIVINAQKLLGMPFSRLAETGFRVAR